MRRHVARLLRPKSRTDKGGSAQTAVLGQRYERDCAGYLAGLGTDGGPACTRLVAALGGLLHAAPDNDPAAVPLDALLTAADHAIEVDGVREGELALRLTEAAVRLRPRSKGAWRARGRALEQAGQLTEAIAAYERYVGLDGAEPRHVRRPELLRAQRDVLGEAGRLLPAPEETGEAVAEGRPLPAVRGAFTAQLGQTLAARGADDPDVRRLAALYATHSRLLALDPAPADHLADATAFGVHDVRGHLAGRTVCVLVGAVEPPVGEYDVLVRCDDPPGAPVPGPLDVHATHLRHRRGLAQQAELRLVFDEDPRPGAWQEALRALTPGAQRYVGDAGLRRPLSDPSLCAEEGWGGTPSTPFVMLRLLDFLDVSPRIDLRAATPLAEVLRPRELDWLRERAQDSDRARAQDSDQTRISLR